MQPNAHNMLEQGLTQIGYNEHRYDTVEMWVAEVRRHQNGYRPKARGNGMVDLFPVYLDVNKGKSRIPLGE